jgi:hypothetical protein
MFTGIVEEVGAVVALDLATSEGSPGSPGTARTGAARWWCRTPPWATRSRCPGSA